MSKELFLLCGVRFINFVGRKDGILQYRDVNFQHGKLKKLYSMQTIENIHVKKVLRAATFCSASSSSSFEEMSAQLKDNASFRPFQGRRDRFHGVIVSSQLEPREADSFEASITASLEMWIAEGVRGVWFEVDLTQVHWVPVLAKHGFVFHHGEDNVVVMVRWLPTDQPCLLPRYAHTVVGVGAMVVREDTGELLVVKEKFHKKPHWKLPGGYVEKGEDLSEAAAREVLEETGVQAAFVGVIATRHTHAEVFSCSDFYFIVLMRPTSTSITMCNQELADCRWMKISEYAEHPLVHETNRFFVQCYLQAKERGVSIGATPLMSSVTRRQQIIYSIDYGTQNDESKTPSPDCPVPTNRDVNDEEHAPSKDGVKTRVSNGDAELDSQDNFKGRTDELVGS